MRNDRKNRKKLAFVKADIEFTKEHNRKPVRRRGFTTRQLLKKAYISSQNKPVLGRASRLSAGVVLASQTRQKVAVLESRILALEQRVKQLEKGDKS